MLKRLSIPLVIFVFVIPSLALTSWYAHVTLVRGAQTQRLFRDVQYQRTRLGLLQVDEETGFRGYLLTGDPRFLAPYRSADVVWAETVQALRSDLRVLRLPSDFLDAMEATHNRWLATVAQPLIRNPHRRDALALQYQGKNILDAFRRDEIGFRKLSVATASAADERLEHDIDVTLLVGAGATVAVLFTGLISAVYQARTAQRFAEINLLYETEKRIADSLQEAFLQKRLPSLPGLVLHATYVPAANQARVGGDWYDAFALPDGRVLFSIGDVAGHGIEAAVVMSRARQAIIAAALHEGDPAKVLERANATIVLQEGVMVTAICGFIDPNNLETIYATAGHPAPILAHETLGASFLPQEGVPLGIFPASQYRTFVANVVRGDLLVLYTDGVTEHERDIAGGEARLLEAAAAARSADNPASALYEAIFATSTPTDDVAILTVSFESNEPKRDAERSGRVALGERYQATG